MEVVLLLVAFLASVAGAICGIGGGVIIKPILDMLSIASVSTISFLSSCTVFSMCLYSVGRSLAAGDSAVDMRRGTPLALGAAAGGVLGGFVFKAVHGLFAASERVGAVQAACLALLTLGTLLYTIFRNKAPSFNISSTPACFFIGCALGVLSSFLGIGGGPVNLVVLFFCFSMDTKTAAQNSLYIILFSQLTNIASTLLGGSVPPFQPIQLVLMVAGGILGGIVGRVIHKKIDAMAVNKLFILLMGCIILVSCYNAVHLF